MNPQRQALPLYKTPAENPFLVLIARGSPSHHSEKGYPFSRYNKKMKSPTHASITGGSPFDRVPYEALFPRNEEQSRHTSISQVVHCAMRRTYSQHAMHGVGHVHTDLALHGKHTSAARVRAEPRAIPLASRVDLAFRGEPLVAAVVGALAVLRGWMRSQSAT